VHRGCTSELWGVRQRRAEAQDWSQQLKKKTCEVAEHLRRQGCVAETQLQTESEDSVELCGHWAVGCTEKEELCWEFEERQITGILRSSASGHWGSAQGTGGTELLNVLWEENTLPRGHRDIVQTGTREGNSLSSAIWKKSPLRDSHRVTEYPENSVRGCLSRRIAREASILFLHLREEEDKIPQEEDRVVEDSVRTCLQVGSSP
jgi:hypothetical protein